MRFTLYLRTPHSRMSVKLRFRRMGRKQMPVFGLVATDSRSPRDGRFIEDLGRYQPVAEPATFTCDADRVLYWLGQGAQPSDTVRNLLQKEGVLLRWALTRQGKSAEEIETAVAEFKERQSSKAAATKKTRAERRAEALEAEKAAAKEKAAQVAKERAEREAELQKQRDEAEAEARREAEAAREEAAAAAADSEALTEAADAPSPAGDAPADSQEAAPDESEAAAAEAVEAASAETVSEEAADAAEEQPAATDASTEAVAADAGAAMADQTHAGAQEADTVTEEPATDAPDVDGTSGEAPTSETPASDDEAASDGATPSADAAGSDALTDISGIGPKYSGILTDAGITRFAQLAETSVEQLQQIITDAGSTVAGNEETWPEQARLLAAGDTQGHEAYVESLKA